MLAHMHPVILIEEPAFLGSLQPAGWGLMAQPGRGVENVEGSPTS